MGKVGQNASILGWYCGVSDSRLKMLRRVVIPAIFCAIVVAPITWMLVDREPPYTRVAGWVMPPAPGGAIRRGDEISIEWAIDIRRQCTPLKMRNVTRRIIDSTGRYYDYEPVEINFDNGPGGGHKRIVVRPFKLPRAIETGRTKYHSAACYYCNPIQQLFPICINAPEIEFIIEADRPS